MGEFLCDSVLTPLLEAMPEVWQNVISVCNLCNVIAHSSLSDRLSAAHAQVCILVPFCFVFYSNPCLRSQLTVFSSSHPVYSVVYRSSRFLFSPTLYSCL